MPSTEDALRMIDERCYELLVRIRHLGRSYNSVPNPRECVTELSNEVIEIQDHLGPLHSKIMNSERVNHGLLEQLFWATSLLHEARAGISEINHQIYALEKLYNKSRYIG